MRIETGQEDFWMGQFGDKYAERNQGRVASNLSLFSRILSRTTNVSSVIEMGSNIGENLVAIHRLLPTARLTAVEINLAATLQCKKHHFINEVHHESILNFQTDEIYDFVFTKGVLIHINPEKLEKAYDVLYKCSGRYCLIAEYYNPKPVEVLYRGHEGVLFKRDFAGEFLDMYPDFRLIDYGFVYHRDLAFPQDDLSWFLLARK